VSVRVVLTFSTSSMKHLRRVQLAKQTVTSAIVPLGTMCHFVIAIHAFHSY